MGGVRGESEEVEELGGEGEGIKIRSINQKYSLTPEMFFPHLGKHYELNILSLYSMSWYLKARWCNTRSITIHMLSSVFKYNTF